MSVFSFFMRWCRRLCELVRRERTAGPPVPTMRGNDVGPVSDFDQPINVSAYRMALATLPLDRRKIFELHQVDGLSFAEIADRTETWIEHVEREIAAALAYLATRLQGDVD